MSNPMTCSQGRAGQDRTGTQQKGYTKTQTHINTQTKTQAQATLGTGTGSWDSTEVAGGGACLTVTVLGFGAWQPPV